MAKKYKMLNYGKKYKQMFIDLIQDTTASIRIPDEITWLGRDRWYGDTNLIYIDFNKVEVIPADTCRNCSNLTQAVFSTHTTQIGDYAFYGCTKFEDTELPHSLTDIGQYAFYNVGSYYSRGTHTFTMIDDIGVHTTIGSYAFSNSHLSEINAYTNNIGSYAFQECKSLTDVNIEIHGSLGSYLFHNCSYIENFEISPNSVITALEQAVFYQLAQNTYQTAVIAPFDFRNSNFSTLKSDVWSYNYYDGVVYFPSTLNTINGNFLNGAQGNWRLYFNSVPAVSGSSYLRNDSSNFTVKYLFPYELLDQVSSATNWASHTSQMIGYGTGFEAGSTLPEYVRSSGVAITWYSDPALTTQITTSSSATDVYYCVLGSTRVVWFVGSIVNQDCNINITDGINTYTLNDPVPVNTSLRITATPTDPNKTIVYAVYINRTDCKTDFINDGYVDIIMNQDLQVFINYWNGIDMPLDPVLANNSWAAIQWASENNQIPSTWQVGDLKNVTYNNTLYPVRLVDKTGKYLHTADNSPARLTFEFVNYLDESLRWCGNISTPQQYDLANYLFFTDVNDGGVVFENFDTELKNILKPVQFGYAKGSQTGWPAGSMDDPYGTWQYLSTKIFPLRGGDIQRKVNSYTIPNVEDDNVVLDEYYTPAVNSGVRFQRTVVGKTDGVRGMAVATVWGTSSPTQGIFGDAGSGNGFLNSSSPLSYYNPNVASYNDRKGIILRFAL